uniref:26S proteasome non-ATPase regulatory subunit 1 n=1 Tax=Angiostrongylus cantonensis TaxID=6313 RepID=A0A158P7U3_ANGCA
MQFIINNWKSRVGGPVDASAFLKSLRSSRSPAKEKEMLIDVFDDWDVLTNTWFEVADCASFIEELSEDKTFPARQKAALLASKVAFCLEDYENALNFALAAETHFKLTPRPKSKTVGEKDDEYVNKIIEVAIDSYKKIKASGEKIDARLEGLINRIFQRNLEKNELLYVIGLALDTRRIDMVEKAIMKSTESHVLLLETIQKVTSAKMDVQLRTQLLDVLVRLFTSNKHADFVAICQCLIKLNRPEEIGRLLDRLMSHGNGDLIAYQIAFDLYENASQQFNTQVLETYANLHQPSSSTPTSKQKASSISEGSSEQREASPKPEESAPMSRLKAILRGEETVKHHMQFLIKNNHTDMLILKEMKDCVRTATAHNATLMANGLMHLGTTCDDFLRDNLDWISKATNWNKFNAVATLGLIHKGHESAAMKLLDPYLPKSEPDQYGFKEGGSLFALGLIHANHGTADCIKYLREQLSAAQTSAVRHGACLGLGLAAMGTQNQDVYLQLRDALYLDDAVTGEAAGLAMGLVMVGSLNSAAFQDMVQYTCDTQHDKIQRGLRTGISLLGYGRQDESESYISQLIDVKSNAMLRSTGIALMSMAYVGSGRANVVSRLLEKVATDPNSDVKRFAVMGIGFLLSNSPSICKDYVGMLVEHFNSHVRYGAAMALGIACAGTGYKEAISLLEPLLSAKENYVRQGAVVALSFIYVQQTDAGCLKVGEFRKQLTKMTTEKGEDSMAKFGAIIAQGILDVGGRNMTISLHNRSGTIDMGGVVGMMTFLQFWYWHSMVPLISLACKPTCLITLTKDLQMPKVEFKCNARASLFAYPPPLESKKKEEHEKVETAVLSITHKKKMAKKGEEKMEVDEEPKPAKEEEKKPIPDNEAATHMIENPARVVRLQLKTLSVVENSRYKPVKPITYGGIIMLLDRTPDEKAELVVQAVAGGTTLDPAAPEKQPHSTFEIDLKDY